MIEKILNCYDSHTHFLATGQVDQELSLFFLKSAEDIQHLKINSEIHFRENWLVGFGWNHMHWLDRMAPGQNTSDFKWPDKSILDKYFPDTPVFFSRVDGHCSWINSKAISCLKEKNYNFSEDPPGGKIMRDQHNEPTGILLDAAHIQALLMLPDHTDQQLTLFLQRAGEIFNAGGFTHVRDLSMTYRQWQIQKKLSFEKKLHIYSESFITAESVADLDRAFADYNLCAKDPSPYMKIKGLKIFIDGSLGSETAFISKNYLGKQHTGLLIWNTSDIKSAIQFCWQNKIEIAIHCIGDEAVHIAATCARDVSALGFLGKIHFEHAQILRPETIQTLKPLHAYVHMQPCHWLSDHTWLKNKIGDLSEYLFQWENLRRNKIKFDFGSDSPIEKPLLLNNYKALLESAKLKIPELKEDWKKYHTNQSPKFGSGITEFDQEKIISVTLDGYKII